MSELSMVDLFRSEVENQMSTFTNALLELEKKGSSASNLEALGAARLAGLLMEISDDWQAGKAYLTFIV